MESTAWQVIIADDAEVTRILLKNYLKNLQADFFEARDGLEVMDILNRRSIDLVILDLRMPGQDGFSVLQTMKSHEEYRHIPVIVQSVLDEEDTISKALAMGAYDYFVKSHDNRLLQKDLLLKARNAIQTHTYYKQVRQEVNQRQQAEMELRASENVARSILENVPHAMIVMNSNEESVYCNKVWEETFHCSVAKGTRVEALLEVMFTSSEERKNALSVVRKITWQMAQGRPIRPFVFRIAGTAGRSVYEAKVKAVGDYSIWQLVDITGTKQREARIKAVVSLLRDFARAIPDSSFIMDNKGIILNEFGNLQHIVSKEGPYAGKSVYHLFPPREAGILVQAAENVLTHDLPVYVEAEVTAAGSRQLYGIRMAPLKHPEVGHNTVAVTMMNVTKQRQSERNFQLSYLRQRRRDTFGDLIHGRVSPAAAAEKLAALGIIIGVPFSVMLLQVESTQDGMHDEDRQLLMDSLGDELSGTGHMTAWEQDGRMGLLWQHKRPDMAKAEELQFAVGLIRTVKKYGASGRIGIAGVCSSLAQLTHAYSNAQAALEAGPQRGESSEVYHFQDAGVMQVLSLFASRREAREYVKRVLGRLIERDQDRGLDLMETLGRLLFGPSAKEIAQELSVHNKTLYFRKRRIETTTGLSLENLEDRLTISVAYKLWVYLTHNGQKEFNPEEK